MRERDHTGDTDKGHVVSNWDRLRNTTAIVGIGQTEFSKASGRSELRMALEAALAAIEDAGINRREIDGLVRYGASQTGASEAWMATNLGLDNVSFWGAVDFGGSASAALVQHAAAAVASGMANYVLCYRSLNGRSGMRPGTADTYERLLKGADPSYDNFLVPYGFTAPTQTYALIAQRHMAEYGTTKDQLGHVAVGLRRHANTNPRAQMHERTLSLEDYHDAPMVSDPLGKFDCCLQTDGAAAVLVTTAERAADLVDTPVHVAAATQASLPDTQGPLHSIVGRASLTESAGAVAAKTIYEQAGMGPQDVDVAQLYDCFTITVLLQLEDYGFIERGEAGAYVEQKGFGLDSPLPVNTDGGNMSGGYLHGINHVLEGVRQLRGTSSLQVDDARTCLVTAGTPVPTSAVMLTSEVR